MRAAMDVPGNPSSVHAEGRAAKALVERARAQVADLVGCTPAQVIFTGSATEAAALAVAQKERFGNVFAALPTEHDALLAWSERDLPSIFGRDGSVDMAGLRSYLARVQPAPGSDRKATASPVALVAVSAANSETGLMQHDRAVVPNGGVDGGDAGAGPYGVVCDITQMAGKVPVRYEGEKRPAFALLSAHKLGGPKGVGALINFTRDDPRAILRGGGQEMGRRSGTENVIGIAGFGAAAEAAARDVAAGRWEKTEQLRNILENALECLSAETIFVGKGAARLPNTSCVLTPGWKGETQVMQMDLAGYAISSGSACSSGKVRASRALGAMGYDEVEAASAIRVSLGLETTEDDVLRFAGAWGDKLRKHMSRAA